jgi:uncharacterized protein YceK
MRFIVVAVAVLLSGCASIVSRSVWTVRIDSNPSNASFTLTGSDGNTVAGKTPATVNLKSGRGYFKRAKYDLQLFAEGFDTLSIPLKPGLNGWYAGNLIFGGPVGLLIVDPLSGSMYRFDETPEAFLLKEK